MAAKDRYTKVQLANFIRTGDVNNPGAVTSIADVVERSIDYTITHNPTAAYAWITKTYGNGAFMNLMAGSEFEQETQDSMSRFLNSKTTALSDDDKLKFVYNLMKALPTNSSIDNWTVPTN